MYSTLRWGLLLLAILCAGTAMTAAEAQAPVISVTVGQRTGQSTGAGRGFNVPPTGALLDHPQDTLSLLAALRPKTLRMGGAYADVLLWNRSAAPRAWIREARYLGKLQGRPTPLPGGGLLIDNPTVYDYTTLGQEIGVGALQTGRTYSLAVEVADVPTATVRITSADFIPINARLATCGDGTVAQLQCPAIAADAQPLTSSQVISAVASGYILLGLSYEDAAGQTGESDMELLHLPKQAPAGVYTVAFTPTVPITTTIRQAHFSIYFAGGAGQLALRRVSLVEQTSGQELLRQGDFASLDFPPLPYLDTLAPDQVNRFIALNQQLGSAPLLTLNLGAIPFDDARDNDNLAAQVDLLRYLNVEQHTPVGRVELGDEPELWFGHNYYVEHTVSQLWSNYVARASRYARALRAVDPNVALDAAVLWFGDEAPVTADSDLSGLAQFNPNLSVHFFPLADWLWRVPCPLRPESVSAPCAGLESVERQLFTQTPSPALRKRMNLNEFASGIDTAGANGETAIPATQADALWTARVLMELDQKGYGPAARWVVGANSPIALFDTGGGSIRPAYYTHYLMAQHWGDELVNLGGQPPAGVLLQASTDASRRVYLAAVNFNAVSQTLRVALPGALPATAHIYRLTASSMTATEAQVNGVAIHTGNIAAFEQALRTTAAASVSFPGTLILPPNSLTIVETNPGVLSPIHQAYVPLLKR